MVITIDGPVASGKSTIARLLAEKLGIYYLSSGLLFRGLAYALIRQAGYTQETVQNPQPGDVDRFLDPKRFKYTYSSTQGKERVFLDGQDITPLLKDKTIDRCASLMSTNGYVRDALLAFQRQLAEHYDLVVEGRDTGSVVFPQADYKFFLTASLEVRAKRWQADQAKKGHIFSLEQAKMEVGSRDARDKERALAPLVIPKKAIIVDTSVLDRDQVLAELSKHIFG